MDRYLIIDTKDLEIITTNEITFTDNNDGSSVKCDNITDFENESKIAFDDQIKALKRLYKA